jgi:pimeloyl-ACP methyl ester carboxylesterase
LRNDEQLPEIRVPVYFFHGDADATVPATSSHVLASLVRGRKQVFIIAAGAHNNLRHSKAYNTALDQVLP